MKKSNDQRLKSLVMLASLYEKSGKLEEAKECFEDAIEIQNDTQNIPETAVASLSVKYGSLLLSMSDDLSSLKLFQKALSIYERKEPGSVPHVRTLQRVGEIYMHMMNNDKALATLVKAIDLWPDDQFEDAADCNRNVGVLHFGEERYKESIPYLNEAVKRYHQCDVIDERFSSSLHLLAKCLTMTNDLQLARKFITEGRCWNSRINLYFHVTMTLMLVLK